MADIQAIANDLGNLTVLQVAELVKTLARTLDLDFRRKQQQLQLFF